MRSTKSVHVCSKRFYRVPCLVAATAMPAPSADLAGVSVANAMATQAGHHLVASEAMTGALEGHDRIGLQYMTKWQERSSELVELRTKVYITRAEIQRHDDEYNQIKARLCKPAPGEQLQLLAKRLAQTVDTMNQLRNMERNLQAQISNTEAAMKQCLTDAIAARQCFRAQLGLTPCLYNPSQMMPTASWGQVPNWGPQTAYPPNIYHYGSPYLPYPPAMTQGYIGGQDNLNLDDDDFSDDE
ncbi:hypothetical protein GNI_134390 [Gregarina niphandrodes]|uniref:Uncharacterized protein n=1 Tax=Gregarina niphandrodes TaxID=110365 RepID=A0A023B114_GRENI|nr:hypothetical protein GNI_134390 [Gregarina niphandrodes]EZG46265.1 hypothetical protein GNI_134390 [Gregarina niphandrodes]|eukprot:XP_011132335.1 hypothetical protein GNI_134390 [Gregarina niphandrodes]